jgi:hypothetical protein
MVAYYCLLCEFYYLFETFSLKEKKSMSHGEVTKCTYGTATCETILDPLYTFVNLNKMKK